MRVLVVDQDSASNLAITRSLRDLYTVDCVTNKADCLDLLRSNSFEVIVATERLEDGSGLELLGQISKKWPSVLRIFAADRQRLQLLRGRLGPFELFQTLAYPIDADKLLAALQKATGGPNPNSREVELPAEVAAASEEPSAVAESSGTADFADAESADAESPAEAPFELSALDEPLDLEQSDEFSEPRFARAGRGEAIQASASGHTVSVESRVGSVSRSGAGTAASRGARTSRDLDTSRGSGVSRGFSRGTSDSQGSDTSRGSSDSRSSGASRGSGGPRGRRVETTQLENDLAAKFPGSGTFGPRHVEGGTSGRVGRSVAGGASRRGPRELSSGGTSGGRSSQAARSGREPGAASKAMPVRFPPLERAASAERVPPLESPQARSTGGDFSEAAALARAARSNYESSSEELDSKRIVTLIGGGVAVAAVVLFLGFKVFGSKGEAPKPAAAPVVTHAPEYPPEVTQLVAQAEAAFKADDFKAARADVDRLRQLSPSHPRLEFFQSLLSGGKGGASGRGAGVSPSSTSKRNGSKGGGTAAATAKSDSTRVAKNDTDVSASSGNAFAAASATSAAPSTAMTTGPAAGTTETPAGVNREAPASTGAPAPGASVGGTFATGAAGAGTPAAAGTAPTGGASAAGSTFVAPKAPEGPSTARRGSGEPPPVVQEAKLIRRVNPDYPSAAKKDRTIGSVDLDVTVSPEGVVENVSVLQATPPDVFDKAAVAAVRKWKYDPRFVDGLPSQAHLKVHLEFGPNK
ncbi:MAG: TonB family protein [Proteobacteria bacterium]|nr:TonB family protein [Pseudomonadota bacterium]